MMHCTSCLLIVDRPKANFCPKCGLSLTNNSMPSETWWEENWLAVVVFFSVLLGGTVMMLAR